MIEIYHYFVCFFKQGLDLLCGRAGFFCFLSIIIWGEVQVSNKKSIFIFIISFIVALSFSWGGVASGPVYAQDMKLSETESIDLAYIEAAIDEAVNYITDTGVNTEWKAIGVARAGYQVPSSYYENYFLSNIESQIINATNIRITDVERLVIAGAALGLDPTNINGTNLVQKIYNSADWTSGADSMLAQGNNGPIFALIALDSLDFEVPSEARWDRQQLVDYLLERQNTNGSWPLAGTSPNYDITAMALIALAPYYSDEQVQEAVQAALSFLSEAQDESGGFRDPWVGGVSSETTSQLIIGLSSLGIDPTSDAFTKDGNNLITHLLSFRNTLDGGFKHLETASSSDGLATEQALQALVAYKLFLEDGGRLYQFPQPVVADPIITVSGLENGLIVEQQELSLHVAAQDGYGEPIDATVIFNGESLAISEAGQYTLQLVEGLNQIQIHASDERGNIKEEIFEVRYEKLEEQQQQELEVSPVIKDGKATLKLAAVHQLKEQGTVIVHLDIDQVELTLPTEVINALIDKQATIELHGENISLFIPAGTFAKGMDALIQIEPLPAIEEAYSAVYEFTLSQNGQKISSFAEHLELSFVLLKEHEEVASQLAVYYANPETGLWEKVGGSYAAGKVTVQTSHFSTFAVFAENELPARGELTEEGTSEEQDSTKEKEDVLTIDLESDSTAGAQDSDTATGEKLPNTASSSFNYLLIGSLLVLLGALSFVWRRPLLKISK